MTRIKLMLISIAGEVSQPFSRASYPSSARISRCRLASPECDSGNSASIRYLVRCPGVLCWPISARSSAIIWECSARFSTISISSFWRQWSFSLFSTSGGISKTIGKHVPPTQSIKIALYIPSHSSNFQHNRDGISLLHHFNSLSKPQSPQSSPLPEWARPPPCSISATGQQPQYPQQPLQPWYPPQGGKRSDRTTQLSATDQIT